MPTSMPAASKSPHPELPPEMGAVVWIHQIGSGTVPGFSNTLRPRRACRTASWPRLAFGCEHGAPFAFDVDHHEAGDWALIIRLDPHEHFAGVDRPRHAFVCLAV